MWLVTDRSVVSPSLRDNFTAGGRMDIVLGDRTYKDLARIFHNLHDYREWVIKSLEEASADELKEDWDYHWPHEDTLRTKVDAWISVTASKIPDNSVNGYDREMLLFDLIAPQK